MWITRLLIQILLYKYKVKQAEVISRYLFTFITLKLQEYFVQSLTVSKYDARIWENIDAIISRWENMDPITFRIYTKRATKLLLKKSTCYLKIM